MQLFQEKFHDEVNAVIWYLGKFQKKWSKNFPHGLTYPRYTGVDKSSMKSLKNVSVSHSFERIAGWKQSNLDNIKYCKE